MASKSCRTERLLIGPFLRREPPSAGTRDECYTPSSVLISIFARYDSNQLIFTTIVIGNTTCLRECAPVCPYSHSAFASIDYLQVSRRRQPADPIPVEEPKREKKKRKTKKRTSRRQRLDRHLSGSFAAHLSRAFTYTTVFLCLAVSTALGYLGTQAANHGKVVPSPRSTPSCAIYPSTPIRSIHPF